ncbi:hypothetical protein PFICI_03725 [Pestalotiopsis fici W106-1]|uniref:Uncharacterized protein n=1 Tax=Pestalotiopsis fici (strain W106-1 / CGMCC3.15140) TaxID=1229662 RepID=W3XI52_PESFW|nr:uncharacterized protein PFICI_03725 [Pestalotiopsis fici W106-1]ETS85700.1 hypothetical protein PFICI_03725 [Pestalotiopsis fici W106-1]
MSLLSPNFVLQDVTTDDIAIASLAFGFTIGFGWLTCWTAAKQTWRAYKRSGVDVWRNGYIWMIWLEISVCLSFAIICWLHLKGLVPPSFAFYFCILTLWALQVQFLLQIIINRCAILVRNPKLVWRLKVGVAVIITAINISVYNIWIPARLQISESYIHINEIWDRCEKGIYLIIDAALNIYFISIVSRNLVHNGLAKYKALSHFNMFIIGFSLAMDVLIIAMMSLKNTFVYMQFHPLAYIVKLNIEMSMAELIVKVAKARNQANVDHDSPVLENDIGHSSSHGTKSRTRVGATALSKRDRWSGDRFDMNQSRANAGIELGDMIIKEEERQGSNDDGDGGDRNIYTTREVHVEFEKASHKSGNSESPSSFYEGPPGSKAGEEDTRPLKSNQKGAVHVKTHRGNEIDM